MDCPTWLCFSPPAEPSNSRLHRASSQSRFGSSVHRETMLTSPAERACFRQSFQTVPTSRSESHKPLAQTCSRFRVHGSTYSTLQGVSLEREGTPFPPCCGVQIMRLANLRLVSRCAEQFRPLSSVTSHCAEVALCAVLASVFQRGQGATIPACSGASERSHPVRWSLANYPGRSACSSLTGRLRCRSTKPLTRI